MRTSPKESLQRARRSCVFATPRTDATVVLRPEIKMGHLGGPTGQRLKPWSRIARFANRLAGSQKRAYDHECFLAHFGALETSAPPCSPKDDDVGKGIAERTGYAFLLSEVMRKGPPPPSSPPDVAVLFTTYHPQLVESHYPVLLCLLMLSDFPALLCAPPPSSTALRAIPSSCPMIDGTGRVYQDAQAPRRRMTRRCAAPFACASPWSWKTRNRTTPWFSTSSSSRHCGASACTCTDSFPRPTRAVNVNVNTSAGGDVGSRSGLKAGDPERDGEMIGRDRPEGPRRALLGNVAAAFFASASTHAAFCSSAFFFLRISGETFTHRMR